MKILTVLTYYRPHTSGLTIYAERLARAFSSRGHQVTILTTQYEKELPREEILDGVRVIRLPVAFRVSKGVLAPTFGLVSTKLVWENDVVQLHLPQFDAPGVALRARLFRKPVVLTYHCDLLLPPGLFNRMVNAVVKFQNNMAGILADQIVTYTRDYADHSAYLSRYGSKLTPILPPVELPEVDLLVKSAFTSPNLSDLRKPVIGMAARFAAEKGVEVLLDAMPEIIAKYPEVTVLFAGQYQDVLGEQKYADRLMPRIREYADKGHWRFLGVLNPQQMTAFYAELDVLVVPSLNSTEAFGLVQIEAMLKDVPSVASDLPGVRQPILMHAMGEVTAIGKSGELAKGLLNVLSNKEKYHCDTKKLAEIYDPDAIAIRYEELFERLKKTRG